MQFRETPSPNFNARSSGVITLLVLHYTGMKTADEALARLCDRKAKVSAHYLIDEAGMIFRLVAEEYRAWHAGVSCWAGETDVNSRSIGIELVNPGHDHGYQDFPPAQMRALADLAAQILARHPIPARQVLGHSDVAPGRKRDPGERFDWAWLARQGVGLWPARPPYDKGRKTDVRALQEDLARYGYRVPLTGIYGVETRAVVTAFQRHFRPANTDGRADAETVSILKQLLTHCLA